MQKNSMERLVNAIRDLKHSSVRKLVDARLEEFRQAGRKTEADLFKEMSFCILTANSTAEQCMRIQKDVDDGFMTLSEAALATKLKEHGYRFPNVRARFIAEARKHKASLKSFSSFESQEELRSWLATNVKGLGLKESSHFLRNIGYDSLAIVDFHIVDILERNGLIVRPKTLTSKRYLEIESVLKRLADRLGMSLAELDLYLWYMETGKILK